MSGENEAPVAGKLYQSQCMPSLGYCARIDSVSRTEQRKKQTWWIAKKQKVCQFVFELDMLKNESMLFYDNDKNWKINNAYAIGSRSTLVSRINNRRKPDFDFDFVGRIRSTLEKSHWDWEHFISMAHKSYYNHIEFYGTTNTLCIWTFHWSSNVEHLMQ